MGFAAASFEAHGMFDVQHFVVHHVFDDVGRHRFAVELFVDDDLLQGGIEAAEQSAPDSFAPSQCWLDQGVFKVAAIQGLEERVEIVMNTDGAMLSASSARLAQSEESRAGAAGVRKLTISVQEILGRLAAIEFAQQNRGGSFDHGVGRVVQGVREADVGGVLAQTNGMSEIRVRMKLDDKGGRAALAAEARVNALK